MQPSGIATSVNTVATVAPKNRLTAIPWKIGSEIMAAAPAISVRAVMNMGRMRICPAFTTAVCISTPCMTSFLTNSTNRIELRTMMPASAINPIIEVAVNSAPIIQCPGMIPIKVNGIGAMIRPPRVKFLNSQTIRP